MDKLIGCVQHDCAECQARNLKKTEINATCEWVQEGECDLWGTECGGAFTLNEGSPSDNNMRFCCYCGAALIEYPTPDVLED